MSTPYPPRPNRLMRDPSNKLIGGVCSGLAKYLNMDVNLVRILTVLISLFTGVPIVLYIIALFVMPEEQKTPPQPPYVNGPPPGAFGAGYGAQSYQQPGYGGPASAQPAGDDVWGSAGAPWEQQPASPPAPAPNPPAPVQPAWQQPPAGGPEPESAPEAEAPQPAPDQTSTWESAPADPEATEGGQDTKPQA